MAKSRSENPEVENEELQDDAVIGRALVRSLGVLGVLIVFSVGGYILYQATRPKEKQVTTAVVAPTQRKIESTSLPSIPFVDVSKSSGFQFTHYAGKEGERLLPETMGGGGGFFDYDNDGDNDILMVNGTDWPWAKSPSENPPTLHLFQNDGKGQFQDVTAKVGLAISFYGMGPSFGDFDSDGWLDLFVTGVGKNHLFRNKEGVFEDVTEAMGVGGSDDQWSCPALWFDYDRDGKLDLLVGNYVVWNRDIDIGLNFTLDGRNRAYGQPTNFNGTFLRLYHNLGDRFEDVSETAGIQIRNPNTKVPSGKALGISLLDADHDGWMDVVVANDTVQNFLFLNQKNGTFSEIGVRAGVAFDRRGLATGAMGMDCGHFRNNENLGMCIGNFANEPCSLYVSRGNRVQFFDEAVSTGFGPQTLIWLTFGIFFADLDLDGRQDIVCCNGHLEEEISKVLPTEQYKQPAIAFWNAGPKAGTELIPLTTELVGEDFSMPIVGRGASYADIDGDGDLDILLIENNGPARLLRNDQKLGHHWLRVQLKSEKGNTFGIGSELVLKTGDTTMRRCITQTRSYLSQCDLIATFGLGDNTKIDSLEVIWDDGTKQSVEVDSVDRLIVVTKS